MARQSSVTDYAHQTAGVEFLRATPRAALFDEPGLGKSLQALQGIGAAGRVLICAPAMVLTGGVWNDELTKWGSGSTEYEQVAYSQLMQRDGRKMTDRLRADLRHRWDAVIFDEAHYLKGRKTHWTQAAMELSRLTDRVVLLTGTPIPNWAHEAYSLLCILNPVDAAPGGRLGSYWRWISEWFTLEDVYGKGGEVVSRHGIGGLKPGITWEQFSDATFGTQALRRLRVDCLDLPPLTEKYVRVDMKLAQKRAYKEMRDDYITWLESGEEITAWSASGKLAKLAQIATGVEVVEPGAKPCSGKLDAMEQVVADADRPTLVLGHFRNTVNAAADRLDAAGRRVAVVHGGTAKGARARAVRDFQDGRADILCASLATISEGLTFTNCDHMVSIERSYRPSINEQAKRRIHRIGQERPVLVTHLVSADTVDENVLTVLKAKTDEQMAALRPIEWRSML